MKNDDGTWFGGVLSVASTVLKGELMEVTYPSRDDRPATTAQVHVLDYGKGSAVIFLSGIAVSWFDWQDLTIELGETNRVVVFDRAGSGLSGPAPFREPSELDDEVYVLRQIMDQLGIERATLVGHAAAAMIAEAAARLMPARVEKLVLLDPACQQDQVVDNKRVKHPLDPRIPMPILLDLMTRNAKRVLLRSKTVARMASKLGSKMKRTPLQTASAHDERAVAKAIFKRDHVLLGLLREYAGYQGWMKALDRLRETTPLSTPLMIIAAEPNPAIMGTTWVDLLEKLANKLKRETTVRFVAVRGSHMLMRDEPVRLATLINWH